MSDFAKEAYLGGRAIVGPEVVNGTAQVYVDLRGPAHLSNAEVRELAAALTEAADYASTRQKEIDA